MKELHKSESRGRSQLDWLNSKFSFSFANYYNPKRMGFGKLLVLNEDIIQPTRGFSPHSHENMEIITIVTEGELEHKDSTGKRDIVKPAEVQVMSAGKGIIHSEYNHSPDKLLKLFQIWIQTKKENVEPRHDKKAVSLRNNQLNLVVSGNKKDKVLWINQDAKIWLGKFQKNKEIEYRLEKNKGIFMFVIEGEIVMEDETLLKSDALALTHLPKIHGQSKKEAYVLAIEVPL